MSLQQKKHDPWPEPSECPDDGVELKRMKDADLKTIVEIEIASFPIPWTRDAFEYDLHKNDLARYYTLWKEEMIVGYAGYWLIDRIAHLTTICLIEEMRGRKLGEWLLLTIMKLGAYEGAERFTLEVRESNLSAIYLYEKVGYTSVGKRENYYAEISEDALVMWTGGEPFLG